MTTGSIPTIKQAAEFLKNYNIAKENRTAVVVGGTKNIGAAACRLLAQIGCRRMFILARTEALGLELVTELGAGHPDSEVGFIPADVVTVEGMRRAVVAIQEAVGKAGVDYLLQCQNGKSEGQMNKTADGIDEAFATQVVSRFVINDLLAAGGYLAPNAVSFTYMYPGLDLPELRVDDLNMQREFDSGAGERELGKKQFRRDSCVLDSVSIELQKRYPQYRFFHAFPGVVVDRDAWADQPWPPRAMAAILDWTIAVRPDHAAVTAVYAFTHPEQFRNERFLDNKMAPTKPSPWAEANSGECWDKLVEMTAPEKSETSKEA